MRQNRYRLDGSLSISYDSFPLVVFIGFLIIGVSGCKKPENPEALVSQEIEVGVNPVLSLPVERVIEGADGRTLKVTIIKRTQTHISIIRAEDQKPFELDIANLSEADRNFVSNFPVIDVPDPFITNRELVLNKLRSEVEQYYIDLDSGKLNGSQTSMLNGKIKRVESDIQSIESQIEEHKK